MCVKPWPLLGLLFCALLLLLSPGIALAEDPPPATYEIYSSELTRLLEIWTQLDGLNKQLQSELTASQDYSKMLQEELTTSLEKLQLLKEQLTKLSNELLTLSSECELLRQQLKISQTESETLQLMLRLAGSSLQNLEKLFSEYKAAAEKQILKLTRQRNWAIAGGAIGTLLGFLLWLFA